MATSKSSNRRNDDGKKRPWGNAYFVQELNGQVDSDGQTKTKWIDLGPVWQHQDGEGLDFTLAVEPIAWRDSCVERRIVIRKRIEQ